MSDNDTNSVNMGIVPMFATPLFVFPIVWAKPGHTHSLNGIIGLSYFEKHVNNWKKII